MVAVFRKSEVSLFGVSYPIIGSVRPTLVSQWAPKQVIGDYSKDSETLVSSWVISDQTEGIGIKDMVEATDSKRCWWSTSELGYKGHLLLPVLVTAAGNPTTANPGVIIEYSNELYTSFGTSVRKWAEGSSSWGSNLYTLPSAPTSAIVHKNKLYFACGTDFIRFNGTTWTTGLALAGTAQPSRYLVEWDSKLFDLDNTGQLDYTSDEGVTWTANGTSPLATGYFTSLFLYRDAAGDVIIYLGTKQGLYSHDYTNGKFVETGLPLPFHDYNCAGAAWWREAAYVSSGMAVYEWDTSSGEGAINPYVGPDRDYGLPSGYRGTIVKLLAGHNALYALLDATAVDVQDLYPAGQYGDVQIYDNIGYSAVLKWDGRKSAYLGSSRGWSVVWVSGVADTPLVAGVVATADDIYRLWIGVDGAVSYIPLQFTIANPLEIADFPFGASSEHITPWFDADNAVVDKLAVKLTGYYKEMTSTEYIKLYYGLDYDDDTWTLLTNATFTDGQIDADGETGFTFASEAGLAFKAIRFKAELVRGSNNALSPDQRWLRLSYIKTLDPKWGFTVRLDCSRNYRFKTAKSLLSSLKDAVDTQTLGAFTFKNGNGSETHQVRIVPPMQGVEIGGKQSEGIYEVNLVAP